MSVLAYLLRCSYVRQSCGRDIRVLATPDARSPNGFHVWRIGTVCKTLELSGKRSMAATDANCSCTPTSERETQLAVLIAFLHSLVADFWAKPNHRTQVTTWDYVCIPVLKKLH